MALPRSVPRCSLAQAPLLTAPVRLDFPKVLEQHRPRNCNHHYRPGPRSRAPRHRRQLSHRPAPYRASPRNRHRTGTAAAMEPAPSTADLIRASTEGKSTRELGTGRDGGETWSGKKDTGRVARNPAGRRHREPRARPTGTQRCPPGTGPSRLRAPLGPGASQDRKLKGRSCGRTQGTHATQSAGPTATPRRSPAATSSMLLRSATLFRLSPAKPRPPPTGRLRLQWRAAPFPEARPHGPRGQSQPLPSHSHQPIDSVLSRPP